MTKSLTLLRAGLAAMALALLSGCMSGDRMLETPFASANGVSDLFGMGEPETTPADDEAGLAATAIGYAAVEDGGFPLAAIPTSKMDPRFLRQSVAYDTESYEPGTVIVDTPNRYLYVVEGPGSAMRYGISVGGSGFSWAGEAKIGAKRHWPKWHPPQEMIDRKPDLEPYRNGMEPGLLNPLGARALYLHQDGRDTLYRLHGTPEWWTIGNAVSSGCIRLTNQDIIDLYERVPMGARVVVKQGNERLVGQTDEIAAVPQEAPQAFGADAPAADSGAADSYGSAPGSYYGGSAPGSYYGGSAPGLSGGPQATYGSAPGSYGSAPGAFGGAPMAPRG